MATYNIDRNINYTNVCVYKCRFCAFYREPGDPEGYLLPFEEIGQKVEETLALNGTGILMQGGVHPDLPLSYYEDLLRYLRSSYPAVHLHAFSPPEVKFIARKERMSFYDVIARLKAAGLMSIPGRRCRDPVGPDPQGGTGLPQVLGRGVDRHHAPGAPQRPAHLGDHDVRHGRAGRDRVEHFQRVRDLQDETGGFTAFISWTFQHEHTEMPDVPETYAEEYLRTLAVSRLFFDNVVHFQTSWVTQGKKIGQAALAFGADDMGSIMIEENVVSSAGTSYRMSQDEMEHLIHSAGYTPKQRTNLYERLVTREETAELARQYRHALTPANRDLAPLLPVVA